MLCRQVSSPERLSSIVNFNVREFSSRQILVLPWSVEHNLSSELVVADLVSESALEAGLSGKLSGVKPIWTRLNLLFILHVSTAYDSDVTRQQGHLGSHLQSIPSSHLRCHSQVSVPNTRRDYLFSNTECYHQLSIK